MSPDYESHIGTLAAAMKFKLELNAHKGDLWEISIPDILDRLRGEVNELAEALQSGKHSDIMLEAADVANFALAAAIIAIRQERNKNTHESKRYTVSSASVTGNKVEWDCEKLNMFEKKGDVKPDPHPDLPIATWQKQTLENHVVLNHRLSRVEGIINTLFTGDKGTIENSYVFLKTELHKTAEELRSQVAEIAEIKDVLMHLDRKINAVTGVSSV